MSIQGLSKDITLGDLSVVELLSIAKKYVSIPAVSRRTKAGIIEYLQKFATQALNEELVTALEVKKEQTSARREIQNEDRKRKQIDQQYGRRVAARVALEPGSEPTDATKYLDLPSEEDIRTCYRNFYNATSSDALKMMVCGVCAREDLVHATNLKTLPLDKIPGRTRLAPLRHHDAQQLTDGLLLELAGIIQVDGNTHIQICHECFMDLQKSKETPPKYSLANGLWIGEQPWVLRKLTFPEQLLISLVYPRVFVFKLFPKSDTHGFDISSLQRGMRGTVSSYEQDTESVASMVQGNLLPRRPDILASLISVAFIGRGRIPKKYLRRIFRVRRGVLLDALRWLKSNNTKYFGDITISEEHLNILPEDDVPKEILNTMHQCEDEEILGQEDDNYVSREEGRNRKNDDQNDEAARDETYDPDVVRLDISGTSDVDLSKLSANELMVWGLANLWKEGKEGGYEVRHGTKPVNDYGQYQGDRQSHPKNDNAAVDDNFWAKSFPFLFPYGCGGFEDSHITHITFREHVRWAMQYYDKRFRKHETFAFVAFGILQRREALASARIQIRSQSYERNVQLIQSVTVDKLLKAQDLDVNGGREVDIGVQCLMNQVRSAAGRMMGSDHS